MSMETKYFIQKQDKETQKWFDVYDPDGWVDQKGYASLSDLINNFAGAIGDEEHSGFDNYRVIKREYTLKDTVL